MPTTDPIYTEALLTQANITAASLDTARRVLADLLAERYTPEAGCEDAIAAYKSLVMMIKQAEACQAKLKSWLMPVLYANGLAQYRGDLGAARILPGQERTTWDGKALDALIASDDGLARVLAPHRTTKRGEPTVRIE